MIGQNRVLSLNIRHGGGARVNRLTGWIANRAPSTLVVTEWRDNAPGRQIREQLSSDGLAFFSGGRDPGRNGVLLAARNVAHAEIITPANSPVGDLVLMQLDGLTVLGCYFPQGTAKSPFFDRCIELVPRQISQPFLMIGDFNTGRNDLDVEGDGTRFDCADQFMHLSERVGLTDLWRFRHGPRRDWTWRSAKNGFRIDHAFANKAFLDRYPNYQCEIDHEPRLTGLTDHSAIVLDLRI